MNELDSTNDDNSNEMIDDRRATDRKKLIVDVHYDGGDATGIANTTNISVGGLFMTTNTSFSEGDSLQMRLVIAGREVVISGTVTYVDEGTGVGIRFSRLSAESEELIKRELERD